MLRLSSQSRNPAPLVALQATAPQAQTPRCKVAPTPCDRPLDRWPCFVLPPPGTSPAHNDAMADDQHQSTYQPSPSLTWGRSPHIYPHSHHGTPAQEYNNFQFGSPQLSLGPSTFENTMPQRPVHQQLQPLVMPQWPSMLNSQSHQFQPPYSQPMQSIQPMTMAPLPTPISATSSRSASTPRKTLTDSDRKQMCQYAEDNPAAKQTEIGGTLISWHFARPC